MTALSRSGFHHRCQRFLVEPVVLALGLFALTSLPVRSATFEEGNAPSRWIHVATTGNDTTGDGTTNAPYRTLTRGASLATPGTAIVMHPGTYSGRAWISDLSGTVTDPIWIGGLQGHARPVLRDADEAIHLSSVRYLVLHDLEISHCTMNGINADDSGEYDNPEATRHVIFRNLFIHNIGTGGNQDCLKLSGVRDFHILDCVFGNGSTGGSGVDHVGCHRGKILGNRFTDMGSNAIQVKGGSSDIEIRGNWFENSGQRTINIGGSTGFEYFRPPLVTSGSNYEARDIRVTGNVFLGSATPFAFVGAIDCVVANNTIIHPGTWLLRILQETTTSGAFTFALCGNNSVVNNIFWFDRSRLSSTTINVGSNTAPSTFVFSHNLWYNTHAPANSVPSGMPVQEISPLHGIDPLFQDGPSENFRLLEGSPAAASGIANPALTLDHGGRPWANPPGRGAWEADWRLNRPPVLDPVGSQSVRAGQTIQFEISASDPDGDALSVSATGTP
jgi:hypothetical protein